MRFLRMTAICFAIALLLLSLPACNSKQEGKVSDFEQSESGVPNDELFVLRFRQKWHPQAQFAGIYMAIDKGFYTQYGIDLRLQPHAADSLVFRTLYNKNTDIVQMDLISGIMENKDGLRVVNIGQVSQNSSQLLIGKKNRGINSIADFNGKKIGLWRSGSHYISRIFLAKEKLDMEIVPVNWSINLFTSNAIDVTNAMRFNEYNQLLQAGLKEEDLFVADLSALGYNIPDDGFYVSNDFYNEHKDICKRFMAATMDGWHYAFAHPEEALDLVLRLMRKNNIPANRSHQSWMLNEMKMLILVPDKTPGRLTKADYLRAVSLLQEFYQPVKAYPFEEFCPND
ncbi:MAG: ABC transporter substrate-binding protein [Candidatus Cloacimonetes bacterium]|jgi:NitT/TauT family transport system substrate-binding protein|nr:ABC transporter substrate-binding protein [Candidatus Cloacimonadota bacterium]